MEEMLEDIADMIKDYENKCGLTFNADHVRKWINQFPEDHREVILTEVQHFIGHFYLEKHEVREILLNLIDNENLTKGDPKFWENISFLQIQDFGNSQKEMTSLFKSLLEEERGISNFLNNKSSDTYVYIDDFLFTGSHIYNDFANHIDIVKDNSTVHIIVIGWYKYGHFNTNRRLEELFKEKNVTIKTWSFPDVRYENRLSKINKSEILWASSNLVDNNLVKEYCRKIDPEGKYIKFRTAGEEADSKAFSSKENRLIIEEQFLIAGINILNNCSNPSGVFKPYGFSTFKSLGFGALVTSYRNCPNNCPLVLWWGDPRNPNGPLGNWYPLLPRKTYDNSDLSYMQRAMRARIRKKKEHFAHE